MHKAIFFLLFFGILFSCTPSQNDFSSVKFKIKQNDGIEYASIYTSLFNKETKREQINISLTYPRYSNNSDSVSNTLNDYIINSFSDFLVTERPIKAESTDDYLIELVKAKRQALVDSNKTYIFNSSIEQLVKNKQLVSLKNQWSLDEAKAHPIDGLSFFMVSEPAGNVVNVDDIVNKKNDLKEIIIHKIKQTQPDSTKSLEELGFTVNESNFAITDNIGVSTDSMYFNYMRYEIAPYNKGHFEIIFSKSEVSPYLNSQFLEMWN